MAIRDQQKQRVYDAEGDAANQCGAVVDHPPLGFGDGEVELAA